MTVFLPSNKMYSNYDSVSTKRSSFYVTTLNILLYYIMDRSLSSLLKPHRCRNVQHARLECGLIVGSSPGWVKPKTIILVFSASLLSTQRERAKFGWLGIRIMCPSGATYVHVCTWTVVSVSQHYKNPTQRVVLVQSRPHHHLIEN